MDVMCGRNLMARILGLRLVAAFAAFVTLLSPAAAQMVSNCQAIARALPDARFIPAAFAGGPGITLAQASAYEVAISYVGHSTFRIETPEGVVIATDYNGAAGAGAAPNIATMNHAHSSHYTNTPSPEIEHVLRGWNPGGGKAEHFLTFGDVLVRNVATDIRSYGGLEESGNSIFIFETAGLCIGHLGHLHQMLSDAQIAEIGRLDIVFVPIDGTYTMNHAGMMTVVDRLRSSVVIPMHWFGQYTLSAFVSETRNAGLNVMMFPEDTLRLSLNTLPEHPTLFVLSREIPF
ncbi:MBL fold metallo-hydrolase [Acuticoccus sp. M5D2P5]|uniref:MBL fold metallo-hydrolase n=1 Tax=Acuticoccus kalidii TaxID=2910977 RepID=UPI001F2B1E60|nr:MBL fold metallo-hydrolase [Acuticoccus kalidii]MCF3935461.1 MBL fold metallo-hydrolase [Acuticoccus kalidii]